MSETLASDGELVSIAADPAGKWLQLPLAFRRDFGHVTNLPDAEVIHNLCLDDSDRRAMLLPFAADAAELAFCCEIFQGLQVQLARKAALAQKRRALVDPSLQYLAAKRCCLQQPAPRIHSLAWLTSASGACQRARFCTSKRIETTGVSRSERERRALEQWQQKLADILLQVKAPALAAADSPSTARQLAIRLAGAARSSTLKRHVQMWQRYCNWLMAAYQVEWPRTVSMILDFLEELAAEPCGKTVPDAFCATVSFMENAAGIPQGDRLSKHAAVQRSLAQITCQLETGAPPTKKARPQPLMLVLALELWVMKEDAPRYSRGFAWFKLLKFWTSSRNDDLAGLLPSSLQLSGRGLSGVLQRTKTSGPGKKCKWLPIFVDFEASFAGVPWLRTGFELWQEKGMNLDRDYFLPLPSPDRASCVACMATYTDVCALSKELYCELLLPLRSEDVWLLSSPKLLVAQSTCRAWSEHSERCWLSSVAAILGFGREQRDCLGRWRISTCSDEYVRSAQRVISQMQRAVVKGVWHDDEWQVKDFGIKELEGFLQETGEALSVISEQITLLTVSSLQPKRSASGLLTRIDEAPSVNDCAEHVTGVEELSAEDVVQVSPYFVTVVGSKRLRRLHRRDGCGVGIYDRCADLRRRLVIKGLEL